METKELKITFKLITLIHFILDKIFNPLFNEENFNWLLAEPPYAGSVAYETAIKELRIAGIKPTDEIKELVSGLLSAMQKKYLAIKKKIRQGIN